MCFFCFFEAGEEISAVFFPLAMLSQYVFGSALFLISVFIVLIILLQRGRGGGLTGALGGAGGASAFGVKAGDIFTRITAAAVLLWIVLCAVTCFWYLPSKLNIATTPSSLSSEKSGFGMESSGNDMGMGGLGPTMDGTVPVIGDGLPNIVKPIELPPAASNIQPAPVNVSPGTAAPVTAAPGEPNLPAALVPQATDLNKEPSSTATKP